ncbi:TolC family protein [Burkholderia cenocepacia]|uniref:TolC family protein n=1 Tax=Burkholderia cenocepacia TaxID=95486 RepID=UPI002AB76615|nr:TolC family protein [Burkholderia cenocepacia]
MRLGILIVAAVTMILSGSRSNAQTLDIFRTRGEVAVTPAEPILHDASCNLVEGMRPLELADVIQQAICKSPRARQAWADARAQAAVLGIADAAYLPTLNAIVGIERDTLSTTYDGRSFGRSLERASRNSSSKNGYLDFSWVLLDFGKRSAARQQALAMLAAANATHNDTLQTVFFNAARAFYALNGAKAALDAARHTEGVASESYAEASARHAAGASSLGDELQARTSYRRAVLDRVSAESDLSDAEGTLAVAMGLDANAPVLVASEGSDVDNHVDVDVGIDQLIDEAKRRQPKLVAARAKLEAARANVDAARAQGRPTISLTGGFSQNHSSYQQQSQSFPVTKRRGGTIGIQVTIPLFEGFASGYRIAQAQALADEQESVLHDAELQVSLDVWRSYHSVHADAANLSNSQNLLADAKRALEIVRGRYKEGVGAFTEVLNVQAALADAQKQRILSVSKWQTSRLKLAETLGKLGFWDAYP